MTRNRGRGRGIGYKRMPGITATTSGPYIPLAQASGKCVWLRPDIGHLVDYLEPHVASAGNGLKFKPAIIAGATDYVNAHILKGGPKKISSVKDKIADLAAPYQVIDGLKILSGVQYSPELGCNIHGPEAESVWDELVRANPDRIPFKNAGWDLYDVVARLHPAKPKGSHTYRPKSGLQGQRDPSASLASTAPSAPTAPSSQPDEAAGSPGSPPWDPFNDSQPDDAQDSLPTQPSVDGDTEQFSPPPPPPPPPMSPTPPSAPAASAAPSAAKGTPSGTPSALKRRALSTAAPPSSKRARGGPVEAAEIMRSSVRDFGKVLAESTNRLADAIRPQVEASPIRRKRALDLVNEKDADWLSVTQCIRLGEMFEMTTKADAYLQWDKHGSPKRKAWVAHALGISDD